MLLTAVRPNGERYKLMCGGSEEVVYGFILANHYFHWNEERIETQLPPRSKHSFMIGDRKFFFDSPEVFEGMEMYAHTHDLLLPSITSIRMEDGSTMKLDNRIFLPEYLIFLLNNWKRIAIFYNPIIENNGDDMFSSVYDFMKALDRNNDIENIQPEDVKNSWSAYFSNQLLLATFGYPDRNSQGIMEITPDPNTFTNFQLNFETGYIYRFTSDHDEFLAIYDQSYVFFCNYNPDAGLEDPFRIERMEVEKFLEYLRIFYDGDVEAYKEFHGITEELDYDIEMGKIYRYRINEIPTIEDMKNVLLESARRNRIMNHNDIVRTNRYRNVRTNLLMELCGRIDGIIE